MSPWTIWGAFVSQDLQNINKKLLQANNSGWQMYLSTSQISVNVGTQAMSFIFVNIQAEKNCQEESHLGMRVGYLFHILFQNCMVFLQSSASPVLQGRDLLSFLSFALELCDPDSRAPPLYTPKHLWNSTKLGRWDFIAMLHQEKQWNRSLVSSTYYLHWILSETNCFITIGRHVKRTLEDSFQCTLQYTELWFFSGFTMKWNIIFIMRSFFFFFLIKKPSCGWQCV